MSGERRRAMADGGTRQAVEDVGRAVARHGRNGKGSLTRLLVVFTALIVVTAGLAGVALARPGADRVAMAGQAGAATAQQGSAGAAVAGDPQAPPPAAPVAPPTPSAPAAGKPAQKASSAGKDAQGAPGAEDGGALGSLAPLKAAGGTVYRAKVTSKGSEQFGTGTVQVWLPKGIKQVRGLYVPGVFPNADPGNGIPSAGGNREALALKFHFGVVTHAYTHKPGTPDRRESYCDLGSGQGLVRGLAQIAKQSGHPEIASAPFVLAGYSLAGHCAKGIAKIMPKRIAVMTIGGIGVTDCSAPGVAGIPGLAYGGAKDGFMSTAQTDLARCRAKGQPLAIALKPGAGHAVPSDKELVTAWWFSVLPKRLPAKVGGALRPVPLSSGMLGNNSSGAVTKYSGSAPKGTSWIPSSSAASAWKAWVR